MKQQLQKKKKKNYCVNFRLDLSKAPPVIMRIIKIINDCSDQSFALIEIAYSF